MIYAYPTFHRAVDSALWSSAEQARRRSARRLMGQQRQVALAGDDGDRGVGEWRCRSRGSPAARCGRPSPPRSGPAPRSPRARTPRGPRRSGSPARSPRCPGASPPRRRPARGRASPHSARTRAGPPAGSARICRAEQPGVAGVDDADLHDGRRQPRASGASGRAGRGPRWSGPASCRRGRGARRSTAGRPR